MKKLCVFKNLFDYILVILLVILSLTKGGFYKQDILIPTLGISIISFIYNLINIFKMLKKRKYKIDIISILLLILSFSYTLPIIFDNYTDLNNSIFEMVRYFNLYFIYNIVKQSNNKKIYIYTIILLTIIQCILSIDAVGNRYLDSFLTNFGSGYLDRDFNRMSGTLQYANVLAILCLISIILLLNVYKVETTKRLLYIYNSFMFILMSTILLTSCRAVILLFAILFIIYLKKEEISKVVFIYLPQIMLVYIYITLIYNNIFTTNVYYIFIVFLVFNSLFYIFILFCYNKYFCKYKDKMYKKYIFFIIFFIFIICYIIGSIYTIPMVIDDNENNNNKIILLDNIKKENNCIEFKIITNELDSRYKIKLNSVDSNNNDKVIKEFNYFDNVSGNFKYKFDLTEDIKSLKLYITCNKGRILLDELYLNNVKQKLNYIFIPDLLVYRFKDLVNGSTSISDRIIYYFDALKIITKNSKNFIIGIGGEGFNNIYKQIQTKEYSSTEVHSSYLQIFVESGIIGFLDIIILIIYSCIKSKKNYIKLAYILLIIHSCIDLNFSYMLSILIFGILLASLEYKEEKSINNKFVVFSSIIISLLSSFIITILSFRSILAMHINIPVYKKENVNIYLQSKVINKSEKRVVIDPYEYSYRKVLNKEYETYLELLYEYLQYENDVHKINNINSQIEKTLYKIDLNNNQIIKNNKNKILQKY